MNAGGRSPLIKTFLLAALAASVGGLVFRVTGSDLLPMEIFSLPDGLEVRLWAKSPLLRNPTSLDADKEGRIWAAEGVDYGARHYQRQPDGDRIVVIEDSDGDGVADKNWTFVQEPALRAPLGLAVVDNQVIVSMSPDLIVYTDLNRDLKFDPAADKREVLLTGFNGHNHDHGLHSVTVGPDGQWYWNMGNCGAIFTDRSGTAFRIGSPYDIRFGMNLAMDPRDFAGQRSDDGRVYVGGFAARMNPNGSQVEIIGHNFRNSYEQTVTSYGDVFQNDNDDPPACRTSFLMLYGNAGYASLDGQRTWQADRRPGQPAPIAHWRQEDPGVMPAGDVYGGGAPTGIAFYENGALGEKYSGLLLSCEAGRTSAFGYLPKTSGAGFALERFDFLASNPQQAFNSSEITSRTDMQMEDKFLFRPSDVVVGADGAIYISDWFDPVVGGGHRYFDEAASGAIYRIAPKGFTPHLSKLDLESTTGQIAALRSPAIHVRAAGAAKLRAQGQRVLPLVAELLNDANPFIRARAAWVLAALGPQGQARVIPLLEDKESQVRVTVFRALRQSSADAVGLAARCSRDPSPAVRREVALSLRDVPFSQARDILVTLARGYDGKDRTYLEAFGTGCEGKEAQAYDAVAAVMADVNPVKWSPAFAGIAWRLHPPQAVEALKRRALSPLLPEAERRAALVALGQIPSSKAALSMADLAEQTEGAVKFDAVWWLLNRKDGQWKETGLAQRLKQSGIYDPEKIELTEMRMPAPQPGSLLLADLLKIKGEPARGRLLAAACLTCHRIADEGVDYGPDLTAFARMQPAEAVLRALVTPSADIAHGFEGASVITTDGLQIDGMLLSTGDPLIVRSQGGITQVIPSNRIRSNKKLGRSLMLGAEELGFDSQQIADVIAYLKSL